MQDRQGRRARVLAELCRRDLVPELWVPSLSDRELRGRLRRRAHLVRMRAWAMNRIFGLLTQWGTRLSLERLRKPDAMQLLEQRGIPAVWRRSIREALDVIDLLDSRIAPLEQELFPAKATSRRNISGSCQHAAGGTLDRGHQRQEPGYLRRERRGRFFARRRRLEPDRFHPRSRLPCPGRTQHLPDQSALARFLLVSGLPGSRTRAGVSPPRATRMVLSDSPGRIAAPGAS